MTPVDKLTIALVVSLVIIVFTIWKTVTSSKLSKDSKVVLYVLTVLMPVVGLIVYLVLTRNKSNVPTA